MIRRKRGAEFEEEYTVDEYGLRELPVKIEKQILRTVYIIQNLPDAGRFGVGDTAVDEVIVSEFSRFLSGSDLSGEDAEGYSLLYNEDNPK